MPSLLVHGRMLLARRAWTRVERVAASPQAVQREVLARLLAANRDTRFVRDHRLDGVAAPADFRSRVDVQTYETLQPYIDEQRRTGAPALTGESPLFYAQTSGTTGQPKYIPVTPTMLAMQRAEQTLFTYLQFRACPEAFAGKALGIMGAAVEARLDTGHPVGSVSGHLYETLPRVVRSRFVVPPEVLGIHEYELKYLVILRLALGEPQVTYMGSPNPTTFLRMLEILHARRDLLLASVASGTLDGVSAIEPSVRAAIEARLRPDPRRATQLAGLSRWTYATLWPELRLVTTWMGGSCGVALGALRGELPPAARVMELGYQSSECRGTIALAAETPAGLPLLHHHFFEFVEQDAWDAGRRVFLGLHELEQDRRYYVLFTTAAGLYRYFINDLVDVSGVLGSTPLLRFVQKGKGVTSLTGEKLYEAQAIEAVRDACARHGLVLRFFVLVADERAWAYTLFLELAGAGNGTDIAADVDRRLSDLNLEYRSKRESGRLGPVSVATLKPGTFETYKAASVRRGQREVQFKPAVLQYRKDLAFEFDGHLAR
jgi:hypothetical protein